MPSDSNLDPLQMWIPRRLKIGEKLLTASELNDLRLGTLKDRIRAAYETENYLELMWERIGSVKTERERVYYTMAMAMASGDLVGYIPIAPTDTIYRIPGGVWQGPSELRAVELENGFFGNDLGDWKREYAIPVWAKGAPICFSHAQGSRWADKTRKTMPDIGLAFPTTTDDEIKEYLETCSDALRSLPEADLCSRVEWGMHRTISEKQFRRVLHDVGLSKPVGRPPKK